MMNARDMRLREQPTKMLHVLRCALCANIHILVCILQVGNFPLIVEELLHEFAFVFCSLIYFAVLLFWYVPLLVYALELICCCNWAYSLL